MSTLPTEQLLHAYRVMRTIRAFEERLHVEFATGEIPGFVHLYAGEEASAAGVMAQSGPVRRWQPVQPWLPSSRAAARWRWPSSATAAPTKARCSRP